jgi:glucosamine--fructose-6-phosphate aminotransferase (isomerizing)
LTGLHRLEYRGYDSCGVAVHNLGLRRTRTVSRVAQLQIQISREGFEGETGIAHTRWATHGAPAIRNAHPHFSSAENGDGCIAIVHNGIIENHEEIRAELQALHYRFESQTDTEVVGHLIHSLYDGDLLRTVQQAVKRLTGSFAIAVFCRDEPHRVVGARRGCPLMIGLGDGENFLASDAMALAGTTNRIIYLEDGDVAAVGLDAISIVGKDGMPVERRTQVVQAGTEEAELGPYNHFMQKEIFEQPRAIKDTLEGVTKLTPELFGAGAGDVLRKIVGIQILACGTSHYAGMTARYWLESVARIPTSVEIASEYLNRSPTANPDTLVLVISQSGETADTLAALKYAKKLGHRHSLAICNVASSAMMRETDLSYLTRAGAEIGVASTKAFTTQLVALFLLTLTLAKVRGHLPQQEESAHLDRLKELHAAVKSVLALEMQIISWADTFARKEHALFLGRGLHYPIALEGALKLKEVSYIHAEGYPAGELKHGPLALVTEDMPVVTVAPSDALIEKLKSNMQEVRARGGQLYVFADFQSRIASGDDIHVIRTPEHYGLLSPILYVVPLQLLAYHTALKRGTDVDKPRNLAKSVTVE